MKGRRAWLALAAAAVAAGPRHVFAQTAERTWRVAMLRPSVRPPPDRFATGIQRALAELGYVEGRNLVVDTRYAEGRIHDLPRLARDQVATRPDAVIAVGLAAARAVQQATTTIPIVFWGNVDPIATGLVTNLARPGGNLTGVLIAPEGTLAVKRLEILKEAVPRASRIALLAPDDPGFAVQLSETREAAKSLGVDLAVATVRGGDFERAFGEIAAVRANALLVGATTHFVMARQQVIALAAKHRLPAMYEWPEQVEDGGLMAYGDSLTAANRRVAEYVDRILRGANPGELPILQPTKFRLTINAKTAKALGLTIPRTLLLRADEVIG